MATPPGAGLGALGCRGLTLGWCERVAARVVDRGFHLQFVGINLLLQRVAESKPEPFMWKSNTLYSFQQITVYILT